MSPLKHEEEEAVMNEEEEEEEEERRGRKRKNKMKMGEDSGLTDGQRRQLRRDQRDLAKKLQEGPEGDEDEDFVEKARKTNNKLFENVRFTREAVLDAENVDTIAAKFVSQAEGMISAPRFDAMKFVSKLRSKLTAHTTDGGSFFDWQTLGIEAGVCYNTVPSRVTFLSGPLENVKAPPKKKARVARQKRTQVEEEELEEQSPELLKKQKKNVDQLSQAERDLKKMQKLLTQKSNQVFEENKAKYNKIKGSQPEDEKMARRELRDRGSEIDMVPFLVNPKSFTQTVENIFNMSFLIKKGECKIKMRESEPLADSEGDSNALGLAKSGCFVSAPDDEDDYEGHSKQCVISFTMKDWRDLREAYELEECDIPHRKGSKQKAFNSQQQQPMSQESEVEEE